MLTVLTFSTLAADTAADSKALRGTWKLLKAELGGQPMSDDVVKIIKRGSSWSSAVSTDWPLAIHSRHVMEENLVGLPLNPPIPKRPRGWTTQLQTIGCRGSELFLFAITGRTGLAFLGGFHPRGACRSA